ncbi:MAG: FAD-binding protein, partial [Halofilum sp. (in: g-proteobacteria)]
MTPYHVLVDACLEHGVMPAVVPELRSITIGGAVSGVGIESSSFRYGLVHATMQEAEVLTGDGSIVTARADNEHADLFLGLPNSYGTLGYALRLQVAVVPVRPYVHLHHERFEDAESFFRALEAGCEAGEADFIDGTAFAPDRMYLTRGRFVDAAPYTSDYGFEHIYYRSIAAREEDYLRVRDYIWRWDTDWFWCSKNVYAQNPVVRRLLGRKRLNSVTYQKIMRWNARWGVTTRLNRVRGVHAESVIQDVDIPLERAAEFLEFFDREIGIRPVWICPLREPDPNRRFTLYSVEPGRWYVNFGFWDVIRTQDPKPKGHFNRKVERKVAELGGVKSLYSSSYYSEDEFWTMLDRPAYAALKARYDPGGQLKDLYRKAVAGD